MVLVDVFLYVNLKSDFDRGNFVMSGFNVSMYLHDVQKPKKMSRTPPNMTLACANY